MSFIKQASEIWRDFFTDGVPSSGAWKPHKADIRQWARAVEQSLGVDELIAAGWLTATAYAVDDTLWHTDNVYICIAAHTSGASTEPGVGVDWETVWEAALEREYLAISPTQALAISPTGNSPNTLASVNVQGAAVSNTTREFLVNLGLTVDTGSGATPPHKDKVVLYAGIVGTGASAGDVWAGNLLTTLDSGFAGNSHVVEFDFNNMSGTHFDSFSPLAAGISISGASTHRKTAAILVSENGQFWNYGIAFTNDSIKQYTYYDLTNSVTSLRIDGTHTYCIDMANSPTAAQVRLRNNCSLTWRNAADNADLTTLTVDAGNRLAVGVPLIGTATAPSIGTLTGLGTSPSASVAGGANGGVVTLTTGTGSPAGAGLFTLTWPVAFPTTPNLVLTPMDGSGTWSAGVTIKIVSQSTTAVVVQWANAAVNLSTSTTYKVSYACIGS